MQGWQQGLGQMGSMGGMTPGSEHTLGEVMRWQKALNEATDWFSKATAGYPLQGVNFSGDYAPLIAQSIETEWTSQTLSMDDIVLSKILPRKNVMSNLHEAVRLRSHGSLGIDPFLAEGAAGSRSIADWERIIVRIKYAYERRMITDVAQMIGIVGNGSVSKQGLATETEVGMVSMAAKLERANFLSQIALNPLAFDGIDTQIEAGALDAINYEDKRGSAITIQEITRRVFDLRGSPFYAKIDCILVDPSVFGQMIVAASAAGRYAIMRSGAPDPGSLLLNEGRLFITGAAGKSIEIMVAPLMRPDDAPPGAGTAGDNPPTAYTAAAQATPVDATALFLVADAGDYHYTFVAVGDGGRGAPQVVNTVSIAAGDSATFDMTDAAAPATGDASIRYYHVYRSFLNGDVATGERNWMWHFPRNTAAGSGGTLITDRNFRIPKTSPVYLLQKTPDVMYDAVLLDTIRRPLFVADTAAHFLLMRFCSPFVKVPSKNAVFYNCARRLG